MEFTERARGLKLKLQRRILIAPFGIEMNANLMAKEERMWIWSMDEINRLMALYGKSMITCPARVRREKGAR